MEKEKNYLFSFSVYPYTVILGPGSKLKVKVVRATIKTRKSLKPGLKTDWLQLQLLDNIT